MIGLQVRNHLDKGARNLKCYPYNGVWIIDQEKFSIVLQMFLLMIGVPQTCFEIALIWSLGKDQPLDTQRIHRKQLIK